MKAWLIAPVLALLAAAPQRPGTLDIYWIDVEGGGSTLIVTPAAQAVLMDTGYAGMNDRDPIRVEHVVRDIAGVQRIDYLLTSHYHPDHVGGLASVAARLPVGTFIDYGDSVDRATEAGRGIWNTYLATVGARRHVAAAGERLTLTGVDLRIVVSDGHAIAGPIAARAGSNSTCATLGQDADDQSENRHSLGYVLRAGAFTFADLGDIPRVLQATLVCPQNLIGGVDLMQAPHHATGDDVLPQLLAGLTPSVIVVNNGPAKGAGVQAIENVRSAPGLQDVWSLHRRLANDAAHNAPEMLTANLGDAEACPAYWIRARVPGDGTFTLTNSRNGYARTYRVK